MAEEIVYGKVPMSSILPSRFQTRKIFDEPDMELAESIKTHGLQVPIKVWRVPVPDILPEGVVPCVALDGTRYCNELIYGERRWRAAKLAGLTEIDALTALNITAKQVMVIVAIENVNRKDLHYLDEAACFKLMLDAGVSQVDIAKAVGAGRTPNYINQSLKIQGLSDPVKEKSRRRDFSRSHALELTSLPEALQEKAFDIVVSKDLSVSETRKLAAHMLANPGQPAEEAAKKAIKPKPASIDFQFKLRTGKGGGIDIVGHIPEGMPEAEADKAFSDSLHTCYTGLEAKAKEAEQNKATREAAGQKVKELETQLGQVETNIEHLEAGIKSFEKAGKDTSGYKQELEGLKSQQEKLEQQIKEQRALLPKPSSKPKSKKTAAPKHPAAKPTTGSKIAEYEAKQVAASKLLEAPGLTDD